MLRHGGSQPRIREGASHHARRGKNAEAFLIDKTAKVTPNEKSTLTQKGTAAPPCDGPLTILRSLSLHLHYRNNRLPQNHNVVSDRPLFHILQIKRNHFLKIGDFRPSANLP